MFSIHSFNVDHTKARTSIRTKSQSCKHRTLRHHPQIELVQELAALAFLAQPSQPVLAHQVIVIRGRVGGRMFIVAGVTQRTVALLVGFTYWTVGGDAVAVGLAQEGREGKCVLRSLMREDLACEIFGRRAQ